MVKQYCSKEIKQSLKRAIFLAVTLIVIANLFLVDTALAETRKITDKELERIKTGLDVMQVFLNVTVTNDQLKTFLNMAIRGGKTSADITYGLVALSSLNEMELVDMVASQRYKTEARNYFNQILDERLDLISLEQYCFTISH